MDLNKKAKENETIRQHTNKLIECAKRLHNLNYISDEKLYNDLLTACEYHDYGKANSSFQKRIKTKSKFNPAKEIPHNVLSLFYVDESKCLDYISVCFAVMYHHYHSDSPISIFRHQADLIENFLFEMGGEYIPYKKSRMTANKIGKLFEMPFDNEQKKYAVLLKGFLHKCDYSASANIECEIENDFLNSTMQNWLDSNSEIQLNSLQKLCLANTDSNIIVTAPTGMGKTEAGLFWCGNNKCFFVLPLKTAINAMYERIMRLSGDEYKKRVALIHSDMKAIYLEQDHNSTNDFDTDYCMVSKQMSLPITVCTPDQIFDFVMKYPGYEYKLAIGSYSKFIIDEIQMYSADLLAAIIYAIEMLHNVGAKFAILTATLPPFVKNELMRIFGEDINTADFSQDGIVRHNIRVTEKQMEADDIKEIIDNSISDKVKKFLVVCNSIDTANSIFQSLKGYYPDISVNLFHSNFIRSDRKIKEDAILHANDRNSPEIWVSTSVVEASLDIDFDMLFTELSDLFSLFQRLGRVNRKGSKSFESYNAYVFTELQGNAKRYHFTDDTIHQFSKDAIMTVDGIITESDKNSLIEEYLSFEKIYNSDYYKDYQESYTYYQGKIEYIDKDKNIRDIDTVSIIPKQVYYDNIDEIEKLQDIIKSSDTSYTDKLLANERIMDLTTSVSPYRVRKCGIIAYINSRYNQIPILGNCEYDDENGLIITGEAEAKEIGGIIDL